MPGQTAAEPNVYEFGTPYTVMHKDLQQKAEEYYQKRGLLKMLERNARVKLAPERWQLATYPPPPPNFSFTTITSSFVALLNCSVL